jgi:hypothetical protein
MGTQQSGSGSNQSQCDGTPDEASTTLGVGGLTSGEEGATPGHETMQETGGSGGEGLTRHEGEQGEPAPDPESAINDMPGCVPQPVDSAMTHIARGPQDTRSHQAGGTDTGLGTPETGANQTPADLEHKPGIEQKH